MAIHMIYARAANGVIGRDNALPWHLPEDLARFKRLTWGAAVVMGRKTWDSLPPAVRPLPGRCNIVVSRQPHWCAGQAAHGHASDSATAVRHARSVEQALDLGRRARGAVWVIGGAQIYAQALALADTLHVTEIEADCTGDAYAPVLDGSQWREAARCRHTSRTGLGYSFVRLERLARPQP